MTKAGVTPAEAALKPQPEGKEKCERDQNPVQKQLRQRVPMDGKGRGLDPPAHAGQKSRWLRGRRPVASRRDAERGWALLGDQHAVGMACGRHVERVEVRAAGLVARWDA